MNIVPWQMLCARVGAELRVIPLNPDGTLQLETLPTLFDEKTCLLAITHVPRAGQSTGGSHHACAPAWRKSAGGWR